MSKEIDFIAVLADEVLKHIVKSASNGETNIVSVLEQNLKAKEYADRMKHLTYRSRYLPKSHLQGAFVELMKEYSQEDIEKFLEMATKLF